MTKTHSETTNHTGPFGRSASGFTLTELLVVITIIAILASLITGAALNAMKKAKQAAITLELQELSRGFEDFNNQYGAYPPNVFANSSVSNADATRNDQNLLRMLKKVSARSTEFQVSADADTPQNNVATISFNGISPAEAVVFWLQGFSDDVSRPLSGTDLAATQIDDNGDTVNNVVTIDSFKPRFDFDRSRLRISRDASGNRRFLVMQRAGTGDEIQIQLYEYFPSNSVQPYVYFDTSRDDPEQVVSRWETTEFFYSNPSTGGVVYPLKQVRPNAPQNTSDWDDPAVQYVEYVEQGKFQILHAGIDDIWGNFSNDTSNGGAGGALNVNDNSYVPLLLAPTGPFLGDIADTLANFMPGTLEDKQE